MIYLDISAIVKLARQERETDALRECIATNPQPIVSSTLIRTEGARALTRNEPTALPTFHAIVKLLQQMPVTAGILDAAAAYREATLRSLDAIHLATAEELRPVLATFIAYDKRLFEAAQARGFPVLAPA